ncbi:hypothetical protein F5X98DRAFT_296299 [Xylaria grammica]|nr:hypothetical protein F5X98DRAFT_296299 [Xylaria grammica]
MDMIKFPLGHGDGVRKLQAYFNVHIGTINMLLIKHGLERIALEAEESVTSHLQIKQRLEDTVGKLDRIRSSVSSQAYAVYQSIRQSIHNSQWGATSAVEISGEYGGESLHKFREGPGGAQVAAEDYETMDTKTVYISLSVGSRLRPGGMLTMAILVGMSRPTMSTDEYRPMPRCVSSKTTEALGGGRSKNEPSPINDELSMALSRTWKWLTSRQGWEPV